MDQFSCEEYLIRSIREHFKKPVHSHYTDVAGNPITSDHHHKRTNRFDIILKEKCVGLVAKTSGGFKVTK